MYEGSDEGNRCLAKTVVMFLFALLVLASITLDIIQMQNRGARREHHGDSDVRARGKEGEDRMVKFIFFSKQISTMIAAAALLVSIQACLSDHNSLFLNGQRFNLQ